MLGDFGKRFKEEGLCSGLDIIRMWGDSLGFLINLI